MNNLIKIINFLNPLHKKVRVHFTDNLLNPIHKNVSLTHIPNIGDKLFFKNQEDFYYVTDVVHYYHNHTQIIQVVIEKDF